MILRQRSGWASILTGLYLGSMAAATPYSPPEARGPFPVGIRRSIHVDPSRYETNGAMYRTFPTSTWYPAVAGTGRLSTLGEFIGPLPPAVEWYLRMQMGDRYDELMNMETGAYRDADLDGSQGPYPVVFFSHGFGSNRFQSWTQCEWLASHGFVVVAPDHYGSAWLTNTPNGVVFFDPSVITKDLVDRPLDVAFFFDELEDIDEDPGSYLFGQLDLELFGLMGHSFGGYTILAAAPTYPFVRAIAPVAPIVASPLPADFDRPYLLIQNDTDEVCDQSGNSNQKALDDFTGCDASLKVWVEIGNSGHFTPSNICQMGPPDVFPGLLTGCELGFSSPGRANAIASAYLTAFFKCTLDGDARYRWFLEENRFPTEMDHAFDRWPPAIVAALGPAVGNGTRVRGFDAAGAPGVTDFDAYPGAGWGVNVASGQVTGLEQDEILTGPGPAITLGPHVRAFEQDGTPRPEVSLYAYATLRNGCDVATGDVDHDRWAEVVTGAGPGLVFGPYVRGFDVDGATAHAAAGLNFFAYGSLHYGVVVATGDVDGDGWDEIVTGPGPGPTLTPNVRGFRYDGAGVMPVSGLSFDAFGAGAFGARVAAGDVEPDSHGEIVVAPGPGPLLPAAVRGFDYQGGAISLRPGFDAVVSLTLYGARPGTGDLHGSAADDLLTGAGPDPAADATVRAFVYDGATLLPALTFDACPGTSHGVKATSARFGY